MHRAILTLAAAALVAAALPPAAGAQAVTPVTHDTLRLEYAPKALCGRASPQLNLEPPLAPGTYFTSVNVHNPTGANVIFRWKVAATGPNVTQGPIIGFFLASLVPDGALRIDCNRIRQVVPPAFAMPVDAFLIIQAPLDLDVVAVYTATPGSTSPTNVSSNVSTMDVERIQPRRTLIPPGQSGPTSPLP